MTEECVNHRGNADESHALPSRLSEKRSNFRIYHLIGSAIDGSVGETAEVHRRWVVDDVKPQLDLERETRRRISEADR